MGQSVKRVQTVVSQDQMAKAITAAWEELFHEKPLPAQVAMVLAQNALETGNRQKMWNYNLGNITTDGKGSFDFYNDLETNEQITPGQWKKLYLKYRSYPSLQAGVKDYLSLIHKKYPAAWNSIVNPDPVAFSKALKKGGYYTANEAPYTKLLSKLYKQYTGSSDKVTPMKPAQDFDGLLDTYLMQAAAAEKSYKKLFRKYLPSNHIVIQIKSASITDSVEFARILCLGLDEQLLSRSFTHIDGSQVEVECNIAGPSEDCLSTVDQLSDTLADVFETATKKIGGVKVETYCLGNKKSSYQKITCADATTRHLEFLSKFA